MPHVQPIEENEASPEVKEVFDDIKKLRQVEEVKTFGNIWQIIRRL